MGLNTNLVIIGGNLTKDPQIRTVNGKNGPFTVAQISVATSTKDTPSYHDIECMGRTAEVVAQYLKKGSEVLVQGYNVSGKYQDKKTNQTVYTYRVRAHQVDFGRGSELASGSQPQPQAPATPQQPQPVYQGQPQGQPQNAALTFQDDNTPW